jgi:hypothetical protein
MEELLWLYALPYELMVLVSEAEMSQGEVDITSFTDLNAIPLNKDIEHSHGEGQTALEVFPFSMHDLLEMANQGQH